MWRKKVKGQHQLFSSIFQLTGRANFQQNVNCEDGH